MKGLHYCGLAFSVFGAIVLLAHTGAAYEAFRGGVIALFLILIAAMIVCAIACIILAASKSQEQGLGLEGLLRSVAPALIVLLMLFIGGTAGAWSTFQGEGRNLPAQTSDPNDDTVQF